MSYNIGIDLGGTKIAVGIVNQNAEILYKNCVPTYAERSFEDITARMAEAAINTSMKAGIPISEISSIGIGTPSCINPANGLLVHANCMRWHNVPLYDEFRKHVNVPVSISNDANCAVIGEMLAGAARDFDNVLMITIGTGVGGGVIIKRKLFSGCDCMGTEFGHTTLIYDGELCTCGRKGCYESYASATALIRQTKCAISEHPESYMNELCGKDLEKVDGKTAFDAAQSGDRTAITVINQYISYIAGGLATLITIFRPDIVIVGGGISNQKENLTKPLNNKLQEICFGAKETGIPEVIAAKLGNDAGIIGSAMLAEYTDCDLNKEFTKSSLGK